MDRRTFVKNAGAIGAAAMTSLAAGCSQLGLGGGTPLEIADGSLETSTTATGDITVSATISNPTEQSRSAELTSQVDVKDGDTYTKSQEITVPPSNDNSYTITHDLDLGSSLTVDQYEASVSLG